MSGALAALVGFSFSGRPTNFGGTLEVSANVDLAVSNVAFEFDGDLMATATGNVVVDTITGDTWFSPRQDGAGSRYWVRATLTSGSTPSGDLDTWLALDTPGGLSWEVSTGGGTVSSTLFFEISSNSGGSNIVASGTVILTATLSGGGGGGGETP